MVEEQVKITRMQQRRGTTATWAAYDPVLRLGEVGVDEDLARMKVGDGATPWSGLEFADAAATAEAAEAAAVAAAAAAEASAQEAHDISNIATPDGLVATLVGTNTSETAVAIDARIKKRKVDIISDSGSWALPSGATRVRVILIGGGGAGKSSASPARGGGGGGLIDVTLPASFFPDGTAYVTIGAAGTDATAQAGYTQLAGVFPLEYPTAYGGRGGSHAIAPGGGGTAGIGTTRPLEHPAFAYSGGTSSPTTSDPAYGTMGGGAGGTSAPGQPGAGGLSKESGDVTNALPGAGGTLAAGWFPGGGGGGGTTGYPGAKGQACLITYFD